MMMMLLLIDDADDGMVKDRDYFFCLQFS